MNLNPIKANMTELDLGNGTLVLFSYRTPVAVIQDGMVCRKTGKFWSVTTSRHINQWFREKGNIRDVNEYPQEFFDNLVAGVK